VIDQGCRAHGGIDSKPAGRVTRRPRRVVDHLWTGAHFPPRPSAVAWHPRDVHV